MITSLRNRSLRNKRLRNKKRVSPVLALILAWALTLGALPTSHNDPVLDVSQDPVYEVVDAENLTLSLNNAYQNTKEKYDGHKVLIPGKIDEVKGSRLTMSSGKAENIGVSGSKSVISGLKTGAQICVLGSLKIGKEGAASPMSVTADHVTTDRLDVEQDYYTCIDGKYKGYSDGSSTMHRLPGGSVAYRVPSAWESVKCSDEERSKLFNSAILSDAECYFPGGLYGSRDQECFVIFYLDDDLLKFDSTNDSHSAIEQTVITNVCPEERNMFGARFLFNDVFYNRTVKSDFGTNFYTRYVAAHEDYRVEFSFVRTEGGRVVMMYVYDADRAAVSDVLYVMRTLDVT